ncbi:MAG: GNAT family N-acetyltransferase [Spirochaetes bacterium]|nr:GNAT family N-acetyltransferase [Spirochaetota bacterium]
MIKVRDALPADLTACAAIAADSEIGRRYGFEASPLEAKMAVSQASGAIIIVAERDESSGGGISGFAWVDPKGAFGSSPYLKLIAVGATMRSSGVGAALLAEFEKRTVGKGRLWTLLVSDFNTRAIAFYERHGYQTVGRIPNFAVSGVTEILMIKART